MSIFHNTALAGASGQAGAAPAGYAIERSLRFNSGDSAYLNRTPSSAGNRKTWTWSGWVKRSTISNGAQNIFVGADNPTKNNNTHSAFYFHPNDQLYFGGWNSPYINTTAVFRDASAWYHIVLAVDTTQAANTDRIKLYVNNVEQNYSQGAGFPAQNSDLGVNQAYPHYMGGNDPQSGYANQYLAEVHFIDGQALDPTSFTEVDATTGQLVPKAYSGGYSYTSSYAPYFSYSNVDSGSVTDVFDGSTATEFEFNSGGGNGVFAPKGGIVYTTSVEVYTARSTTMNVSLNGGANVAYGNGWTTIASGSGTLNTLTFSNGNAGNQRLGAIRVDGVILTTGTFNGTNSFHLDFSDNSSNAALGTDQSTNNNDWTVNNITANAPGLATAKQGMDVVTYTGNGSTQTISGLQFQPDFVWIKRRDGTNGHRLQDVIRGTNYLESNTTAAEVDAIDGGVTAFNSDGFTIGAGSSYNNSSASYVGWCWKAGGTASSNTDGSITSQVSANTTYGFSIVSYTGNGTSGATVGHGLNAAPYFYVVKRRNTTGSWLVYHNSTGATKWTELDSTGATQTGSAIWNDTAPTSSVFSLGTSPSANGSGNTFIAYCWSEVAGFSKFGSYTGTGAVGHKITTGFKPAYILFKRTDSLSNWRIVDEKRGTSSLNAETNEAEQNLNFAINADGFTINQTGNNPNASGGTYIYAAFAGTPAGEDVDSLFDSPTNGTQTDTGLGGEVSGNYATLNPLATGNNITLSNGNLQSSEATVAGHTWTKSTIGMKSGKWYAEITVDSASFVSAIGLTNYPSKHTGWITADGAALDQFNMIYFNGSIRQIFDAGVATTNSIPGVQWSVGDVLQIAYDADNGKAWFGVNNTWYQANGSSTTLSAVEAGNNATFVNFLYDSEYFFTTDNHDAGFTYNFGQRAFAYTAPSGFKALNTANLSDPTIADGSDYMDVVTYNGNGTSQTISGLEFSPDFVWIKGRNADVSHQLYDIIRGTNEKLSSNTTDAETTTANSVTAFNSNGFDLGSYSSVNTSSNTYAAWTWDAGTSTVSNTDGSITSQVRANASAGFSIVTYTGTGSSETVGHGLNAAPEMILLKDRNASAKWKVLHIGAVSGSYAYYQNVLHLDTAESFTGTGNSYPWGGTAPTSSVFSVANVGTEANRSGSINNTNYVAYCFAPVEGYSAFGSYTGNGSADGPFVYTGFRPKWIMFKRVSAADPWIMYDSSRSPYNQLSVDLAANDSRAESSTTAVLDFTSNGFKLRNSGTIFNQNGSQYIYMCFAENPFKYARAR